MIKTMGEMLNDFGAPAEKQKTDHRELKKMVDSRVYDLNESVRMARESGIEIELSVFAGDLVKVKN